MTDKLNNYLKNPGLASVSKGAGISGLLLSVIILLVVLSVCISL